MAASTIASPIQTVEGSLSLMKSLRFTECGPPPVLRISR